MPETSTALIDQLVYIDNFLNNGTGDTPQLDVDGQLSLDLAAFADDSFIFPDEDKPKHPHDDDNNDDFHGGRNNSGDKLPNLDGHMSHDIDTDWLNEPTQNATSFDFNGNIPSEGRKALASINLQSRDTKGTHNQHDLNGEHAASASDLHSANPGNGIHSNRGSFAATEHPNNTVAIPDLSHLPKFPVPPGAESSLIRAGLSHSQIDLLAALIAQHQTALGNLNLEKPNVAPESDPKSKSQEMGLAQMTGSPIVLPTSSPILLGQNGARGGRTTIALDSPESTNSNNSSGYNSGSVTSTPQLASRSSTGGSSAAHSEIDKRKRNTEASARFRIKRKMREKEMGNRMMQLDALIKNFEVKITELEMENRLLKNLIIEKGDQRSTQELQLLKEKAQRR